MASNRRAILPAQVVGAVFGDVEEGFLCGLELLPLVVEILSCREAVTSEKLYLAEGLKERAPSGILPST